VLRPLKGFPAKVQKLKDELTESFSSLTTVLESNVVLAEKVKKVEIERDELAFERFSWRI